MLYEVITGIGPARFNRLLEIFGDPADILNAGRGRLHQFGLADSTIDALRQPDVQTIEHDLEWQAKPGNRIMTCQDTDVITSYSIHYTKLYEWQLGNETSFTL